MVVAINDVDYNEHPDKGVFERQWLSQLMGGQIQQGIYMASSAGKYLGRANLGWPDPDPLAALAAMRKAVADYGATPKAQRVLARDLDARTDKLKWEQDGFTKPPGTLDLRISSRGYPFEGMSTFDQRHPMFFHVDRLWFKPSEWRRWLPSELKAGAAVRVEGPARSRIVMLSHMQAGGSAWDPEHLEGGTMTSTITSVDGDTVELRIAADYDMRADTQWNKSTYRGNLLAFATYDRKRDAFTRFDLAMLGTQTLGRMMSNLHVGSPTQRIAASASLNPLADADDRMIPQQWKWRYTLAWCRTGTP